MLYFDSSKQKTTEIMTTVLNKLIEQELSKMSSKLTTELQKKQAKETLANVWRIMVSENLNQEAENLKQRVESVTA